jgi:hypothetical protein
LKYAFHNSTTLFLVLDLMEGKLTVSLRLIERINLPAPVTVLSMLIIPQ